MKKNEEGIKFPILFMSIGIQGAKLNYLAKEAYNVVKSMKQSRPYILKSHMRFIVLHMIVRSLFIQKKLGEM
jgi:hypothetical protein